MVLKKPSEIFKNNNNDSSKESDKKIHQKESKVNKRIISPKELFGEIVEEVAEEYVVEEYDRLLQICAPGLAPIVVEIVDTIDELGNQTERGVGGFGSTGR